MSIVELEELEELLKSNLEIDVSTSKYYSKDNRNIKIKVNLSSEGEIISVSSDVVIKTIRNNYEKTIS